MQLGRGNDAGAVGRGGFVSIGNFDGVHNGHKRIAQKLVDAAVAAEQLRPTDGPLAFNTEPTAEAVAAALGVATQ